MVGSPEDEVAARLARALAGRDATFLDDREGATLEGVFRPRRGALSRERLRAVLRSWELFDRAYEPLPAEEARALVATRLHGLVLDEAAMERLAEGLVVFGDGLVVALEAETFRRLLASPPRA